MKKKSLPIIILSSLFSLATLTGCTKDELASMKKDYTNQIAELQAQIDEINTKISDLRTEMNTAINEAKEDYQAKIDAINAEITTLKSQLTALETKHNQEKAALEADYNSKISALETSLANNVSTLTTSINTQSERITTLQNKHDQDVAKLREDYEHDLAAQEATDAAARAALKSDFDTAIATLDAELEEQVTSLNSSTSANALAIANLTSKHAQDVAALELDYQQKIDAQEETDVAARATLKAELEAAISALDAEYEQEVTTLNNAISANTQAISSLTSQHNQDIEDLQADYEQKLAQQETADAAARAALKSELESELSSMNQSFAASVTELQTSIASNVSALNTFITNYNSDKQTIEEDYNEQIADLDEKYGDQITIINSQISSLQSSVSSLTSEMNAQISAIQNDYISKINALTTRVSALETVEYHTVTFVVEGDNPFSYEPQIVKHGEKATKPEFVTQDGYEFALGNTFYADSGHGWEPWYFRSSPVTEDIQLHAIAEANSYTISLDENFPGGSQYDLSEQVKSGHTFSCPVPYRDGYVFEGWYKDNEAVTDENGDSLNPFNFAANISLTAYWHSASGSGTDVDNPFTPTAAREYIDNNVPFDGISSERIYVGGIVASKSEKNSTYNSFNIFFQSDDGTDEKYFEAYHALEGSGIYYDDIQPGDYVIVEGYAKQFNGQYELSPDGNNANNPTVVFYQDKEPVLLDIRLTDRTVRVNSSIQLEITPIPSYAPIDDVYWMSTSTNIEISTYEGEVIGISEGEATVYCYVGTSIYSSCIITVLPESSSSEYTLTINPSDFETVDSASIDQTISGITFSTGTSNGTITSEQFRVFSGSVLYVSFSTGSITKIEITCTANGTSKYGPGSWGAGAPTGYTFESDGKKGTWEGDTNQVVFVASSNQVRITQFKITIVE